MTADRPKARIALLKYRFEAGHGSTRRPKLVVKEEIIAEAIDFLRRRQSIVEKVYFHRTKLAAGSMLISAVASSSVTMSDLIPLADAELIARLRADESDRTRHLISAYSDRRLYHPVYQIHFEAPTDDTASEQFTRRVQDEFRDPVWRAEMERTLEAISGLKPGSVSVYCPDRKMNVKQFEMLVQTEPDGHIKYLKDSLSAVRQQEMHAINDRFEQLWMLQVFVDDQELAITDTERIDVQDFSALCVRLFDHENDLAPLARKGKPFAAQIVRRVVAKRKTAGRRKVTQPVQEQLEAYVNALRISDDIIDVAEAELERRTAKRARREPGGDQLVLVPREDGEPPTPAKPVILAPRQPVHTQAMVKATAAAEEVILSPAPADHEPELAR